MASKKIASAASQLKRKGSSERAASAVDSDGEKVVDQGEKKKARLADGLEKPEQTDEVKKGKKELQEPTRQKHGPEEEMEQHLSRKQRTKEEEQDSKVQEYAKWFDESGIIKFKEAGWLSAQDAHVKKVAASLPGPEDPKVIFQAVLESKTGRANYEYGLRQAEGVNIDFRDPKRAAKRAQRIEKQPEGFTSVAFPNSADIKKRMSRLAREGGEAKDSSASGSGSAKQTKAASSLKISKKWTMERR